jgi:hypothetical protein
MLELTFLELNAYFSKSIMVVLWAKTRQKFTYITYSIMTSKPSSINSANTECGTAGSKKQKQQQQRTTKHLLETARSSSSSSREKSKSSSAAEPTHTRRTTQTSAHKQEREE